MSDKSILKRIFESTTSQDLSLAALDFTTSIDFDTMVSYVSIRFSAAVSETLTITVDANTGANYDIVIARRVFSSRQNIFFQPNQPLYLKKGSELRIQCTNGGATGTAYVVVSQVQA